MISRGTIAERSAILVGLVIAPVAVLLALPATPPIVEYAASAGTWLATAIVLGLFAGGLLGAGLYLRWLRKQWHWHSVDESAELLQQCATEIVTGKADPALLEAADKLGGHQEGRVTAIYVGLRSQQLRRQKTLKEGATPNPISWQKRAAWGTGLLLSSVSLALIKPLAVFGVPLEALLVPLVVLLPFWVTGLLICVAGMVHADRWLNAVPLPRMPALPERIPKVKKRKVKSVGGRWHIRTSATDVPIFRGLLVILLVIAAALYFLREYVPSPFSADPTARADAGSAAAPEESEAAAAPVQAVATPRPTPRPAAPPTPVPTPARPDAWNELPPGGSRLEADAETLRYAGWDADNIRAVLAEARDRIDGLYAQRRREIPGLSGAVTYELVLQPYGRVSELELIATTLSDEALLNGVHDRLEALDFGGGAFDPVRIQYSMDFRP